MTTNTDINFYINWALNAVYGRLAEADAIMHTALDGIRKVAATLRERHPIAPMPLHRGVLLDPSRPFQTDPTFSFVSWSESLDVARWFGSTDSYISEPFRMFHPEARGYVLTLDRPASVLFHYSWVNVFGVPLDEMALLHPHMQREGQRQIAWSLRTQREVITEPLATLPTPAPVESMAGAPVPELDRQLSPPWITA